MITQELSLEEAYSSMVLFLEEYYARTNSSEIGVLLGSMDLMKDGRPLDAGMWSEWVKSADRVRSMRLKTEMGRR